MDRWYRERMEPMRHPLRHGQLREHLARYRFAADLVSGRVLDAGCGTGYGSHLLAHAPAVREVLGVDSDPRAIRHASRFYAAPNLRYQRVDLAHSAARALGPHDGVVCFEVLEHSDHPEAILETLALLLAPGGRLLLSTPLGRGREVPSSQEGHHFQLRRQELEGLLAPWFDARIYGQKGEGIEPWRRGGRYFLMLAVCAPRACPPAMRAPHARPPQTSALRTRPPRRAPLGRPACGTSA